MSGEREVERETKRERKREMVGNEKGEAWIPRAYSSIAPQTRPLLTI